MMKAFDNIYFKSRVFLLIVFVSLLSQISIAQNNISDTIVINGIELPSTTAFNYRFSLAGVLLGDFDINKDPLEPFMNGVVNALRPFEDAEIEIGVNFFHTYFLTPLIYAVVNENVDAVNSILEKEGANPNLQDSRGLTALIWAGITGNVDIARSLVNAGADDQSQMETAIQFANEKGNEEVVNYLSEQL